MESIEDLGWREMPADGFIGHVGPLFEAREGDRLLFAFRAGEKHRNLRGVVQGGMLMTFFDRAMGQTVRNHLGSGPVATVQLDVHFVDAARIGDFVVARPAVVRATRSIVFVEATLSVDERLVATAKGIWKRLRPQPAAAAT